MERWSLDSALRIYIDGMKPLLFLVISLFTTVLFQGSADAALVTTDCTLSHADSPAVAKASCSVLEVPLDHDQHDRGSLSLHLAVIPAENRRAGKTPLFFFAGGPGQSAMSHAANMTRLTAKVGKERDIVFIDQRGTGKSSPLNCPGDDDLQNLRSDDAKILKASRECLQNLTVDPVYFTSYQAVHDAEQVRIALGYEQIDLLGISYGTRMAQLYLKAYPLAVRSVILDGVVPLDEILGQDHSENLHASLALLVKQCAADKTCGQAFPDLDKEWQSYLDIPKQESRQLTLVHPSTGKQLTIDVNREVMDTAVRLLSYSNLTQSMLPLLIHITASGDWQPMVSQSLQVSASLQSEISLGMHNSVVCSEDAPFMREDDQTTEKLLNIPHLIRLLCQDWPRGTVFDDQHKSPVSSVPVLILSGELDPVTPPRFGEQAAQHLSNKRHIVVPGQGHNVIQAGCIPGLAKQFLDDLELTDEDVECVADTEHLPFFIDLMGPAS